MIRAAGCAAVSLALGIIEASRLVLWNYGLANSVWADGVNYLFVSTLLNLPFAAFVYWLGRRIALRTARGRASEKSGSLDPALFLSTFLALSLVVIAARSLMFVVPAAAALFAGAFRLLAGRSPGTLRLAALVPGGLLLAWAGWGISQLPSVPHDYEDFIRKGPLRKIARSGEASPHVLFIVVDTLRSDHLQAYGYARETSPLISRLAREGIRFTGFRANSNETSQTVASLLTGRYPSGHGLLRLGEPLPEGGRLLTEVLQKEGYNTAFFTSHWFIDGRHNFDRGTDYLYSAWEEQPFRRAGVQQLFLWLKLAATLPSATEGLKWLDTKKNDVLVRILGLRPMEEADRLTDKVLGYIDHAASRPDYDPERNRFFLFLFFHDLHWPRCLPPPYHRMFDPGYAGPEFCRKGTDSDPRALQNEIARYDGALRFVDDQMGRILGKLKALGWLNRSMVVLTADHGEKFGAGGEYGHGGTLWEDLLRIPLILWQPSLWPKGRTVEGIAEQVDLLPTLLDLLKIPIPPGVQGRSLVSRNGSFPASTVRRTAFGEAETDTGRYAYVLREGWKLLVTPRRDGRLFHLEADPQERVNLYGRQPQTRELEEHLNQQAREARSPRPWP
ncbi:MAG: sulfatase [Candidatus Tectomicrobia bacterium]|nr:sulfatase [Candidatus Tectomicrobia bacterium]